MSFRGAGVLAEGARAEESLRQSQRFLAEPLRAARNDMIRNPVDLVILDLHGAKRTRSPSFV
ncbi:MAG: hypothetical protein AAB658_01880, partial [Chloroflexota bacterium]